MNQRLEAVERWARNVKNSNGGWKAIHTEFINSQFQKAEQVMEKLSREKGGGDKIIRLYGIKNKKGYPNLLRSAD